MKEIHDEVETLRDIALTWRKREGRKEGIVMIWNSEVYGWKNELRNPESERPGSYAIDDKGIVFKAVGGNCYDGAKKWNAVANQH